MGQREHDRRPLECITDDWSMKGVFTMIQKELCKAAAGKAGLGNKVPAWKTILAGEKVPVDVYRVEDGGRVDFNLETGRFSCRIGGGG